jgi:hypothetical protein
MVQVVASLLIVILMTLEVSFTIIIFLQYRPLVNRLHQQIEPADLVNRLNNEGKSAARFCHQLAALFPDMFCNFYLVKNHNIAKNSTTIKTREKISADLESI